MQILKQAKCLAFTLCFMISARVVEATDSSTCWIEYEDLLNLSADTAEHGFEEISAQQQYDLQLFFCAILVRQNRFEETKQLCLQVIEDIGNDPLGNTQTRNLNILSVRGKCLALCFAYEGRWNEAALEIQQLLNFYRRNVGLEHFLCRGTALQLAFCWYRIDPINAGRADELIQSVLKKLVERHGLGDRQTLTFQSQMAQTYLFQSRFELAVLQSKTNYETARRVFGHEDVSRIRAENDLAISVAQWQNRSDTDVTTVLEILERRAEHIRNHAEREALVADAQIMYVRSLAAFGEIEIEAALELLESFQTMLKAAHGTSSNIPQSLNLEIAVCAHKAKQSQKARNLFRCYQQWRAAREEQADDRAIEDLILMASTCQHTGDFSRARRLFIEARKLSLTVYGPSSERTVKATQRLGVCLRAAKKNREAVPEFALVSAWMQRTLVSSIRGRGRRRQFMLWPCATPIPTKTVRLKYFSDMLQNGRICEMVQLPQGGYERRYT